MANVTGTGGADAILVGFSTAGVVGVATDGNDSIDAAGGADIVQSGGGNDRVHGGGGGDNIDGGAGNDRLFGDGGSDTIDGNTGNDTIAGDAGDDFLAGGDGNDIVRGGADNDVLGGGNGVDSVVGGGGSDEIISARDGVTDILTGGAGADEFRWTAQAGASDTDTITDFKDGVDHIDLQAFGIGASGVSFAQDNAAGGTFVLVNLGGTASPEFKIFVDNVFAANLSVGGPGSGADIIV